MRSVVNELAVSPSSIGRARKDAVLSGKVKAHLVDAKDVQASAFKVVTERGVVYLMGRVTEREATPRRRARPRHRPACRRWCGSSRSSPRRRAGGDADAA